MAPDTDLRRRKCRECVVDYRTGGCPGRDEMDVGVRSCSCGVAEKKSATRTAHSIADRTHAKSEPYAVWNSALQGCACARMVHRYPWIVQFGFRGVAYILSDPKRAAQGAKLASYSASVASESFSERSLVRSPQLVSQSAVSPRSEVSVSSTVLSPHQIDA